MNRLFRSCAAGLLLAPAVARRQQAAPAPTPPVTGHSDLKPYALPPTADTAKARTLAEGFRRGQWHGRVRNYFMANLNRGGLPDYYANGLGAGARFETAPLHGFQLGAGGFFWANLASSDLATPDAATGAINRFEVGLFDVTDPGRRRPTGRPLDAGQLTLGGQYLNQRTVGDGGNADPRLVYGVAGGRAHALSARLGYQRGPWSLSGSYTRITRAGRFLFSARVGPRAVLHVSAPRAGGRLW